MRLREYNPPINRQTKYVAAVVDALAELGHATNAQIHELVQKEYPEVSATTIHRVTSRLKKRGLIGCAPKTSDGSERYDISTDPHHHFMCTACDNVCDFPDSHKAQILIAELKELSEECALAGRLTLSGVCEKCSKEDLSK